MALLDDGERTADATASNDCDLLVISHRDFIRFLDRRANLTAGYATGQDIGSALHPLRHAGASFPPGLHLPNELAAARESVSRQLLAWQRAGLLELGNREIVIPISARSKGSPHELTQSLAVCCWAAVPIPRMARPEARAAVVQQHASSAQQSRCRRTRRGSSLRKSRCRRDRRR